MTGNWSPSPDANAIQGTISRSEIDGTDDIQGALFPTKPEGISFLQENNAWGFVRVSREPEFVAIYVSGSAGKVQYFARVKEIVRAEDVELARPVKEYPQFDRSKSVLVFEPGSLYKLEDPIPYRVKTPISLRYTSLGRLRSATGTDELF
jgi:hypothetical protein